MRFLPFVFALSLFATVNEPISWEVFSGYRNDRVQWHLQVPGTGITTYDEMIRNLSFWENGIVFKTIYRDLVFFINGSYSAFGIGTAYQSYPTLSFASDTPRFHFDTHGWGADTTGYFGYAVNLTPDRTYKVMIIPLFGYSAHFEQLKSGDSIPSLWESTHAVGATSYTLTSSLPNILQLTWYGIFIGANFQIEPGGRLVFSGGYNYNWLNTRFTGYYQYVDSLFNPALSSEDKHFFTVSGKTNGSIGQTGWLEIDYILSSAWKCGIGSLIYYFCSPLIQTNVLDHTTPIVPAGSASDSTTVRKLKIRWTSVRAWAMVSRAF